MLTPDLLKSIWNIFQSLFWLCQLPGYQSCCIVLLDEIGHTATLKTSITSLANSITSGWRTESITLGKNAWDHSTEPLHVLYSFYITFWADRIVKSNVLAHKMIYSETALSLHCASPQKWDFLKNDLRITSSNTLEEGAFWFIKVFFVISY
jgi:hypothetical protein